MLGFDEQPAAALRPPDEVRRLPVRLDPVGVLLRVRGLHDAVRHRHRADPQRRRERRGRGRGRGACRRRAHASRLRGTPGA